MEDIQSIGASMKEELENYLVKLYVQLVYGKDGFVGKWRNGQDWVKKVRTYEMQEENKRILSEIVYEDSLGWRLDWESYLTDDRYLPQPSSEY